MSMMSCERCARAIDTDHDTECEVYTGNYKRQHSVKILCGACRDTLLEEEEAADSQRSWAEAQQEEADRAR